MKKKLSLIFLFCLISSFSIGFGSYIIENLTINGADDEVLVSFSDDKNNYKKVEFYNADNTLLKTMYLNSEDTIGLMDAPYYYDGSNYYEWQNQDKTISLNPVSKNGFTQKININKETKFVASVVQLDSTDVSNSNVNTETDTSRGDVQVDSNNNSISFNQNSENLSGDTSTTPINVIKIDEPYLNDVDLSMTFNIDGENKIENVIKDTNIQANNDKTIGLEDPTSVGSYADSNYKPNPSGGKNYCVNRMILESDLVLSGGSSIQISALTSFYGDNNSFSQCNYQGFITGPYSELDLNGHTLIVSNGCSIRAIGSITDSSSEKTGKIIVESGGSIAATFVVEDQHHETSAPMTYLMGGPLFSMYRMPYLNVPMYFKSGSTLNGILKIDWGGSNKNNTSENTLNIIGNSDSSIFKFNDNNGYIYIEPSFDLDLKNSLTTSEVAYKNIMYQTFKIELYESDISINLPTNLSTNISGMDFVINFEKNSFNVPPYFDIYLTGTRCEFHNMITFMPGASLHVDKNSELVFSTKGFQHFSGFYVSLLITTIDDQYFTSTAGLNFIYEKYDFSEALKRNDSSDSPASTDTASNFFGGTSEVYLSTANFWKYVNKKHAFANIEGKITFNPITNIGDGSYLKYNIGGIFNISNLDGFIDSVNACKAKSDCIEFYASTFKSGPDRLTQNPSGLAEENRRFNINDFYNNPLVSNGYLLTDVNNIGSIITNNTQTFDFVTGLAKSGGNYFGLFPVNSSYDYNYSILNLQKSNYGSESDYRNGYNDSKCDFIKVIYNSTNNSVSINDPNKGNSFSQKTFAFFRGCFVPYNGSQLNVRRFRVRKLYNIRPPSRKFESIDLWYTASYKSSDSYYGHDAWRLS